MKTCKFEYQKMPKYRGKLRNFIESSSKNIGGKSEIMCLKRSEKSSKLTTFKTFRRNPRYSYHVFMLKGHKVENNISHLIFQGQDDFQLELCTITLGMDHTSDFLFLCMFLLALHRCLLIYTQFDAHWLLLNTLQE